MESQNNSSGLQELLNQHLLDLFLEASKDINKKPYQQEQNKEIVNKKMKEENVKQIAYQFLSVKHNNIIKNILKSFQKFIQNISSEEQQLICHIIQKIFDFQKVKKVIKRSINTLGKRWNMKLKFIIEKSYYKPLFEYYLNNIAIQWLNESKVQNKEEHLIVINFLKEALNNSNCINLIKFYKKHKKFNFQ